MRARAGSLCPAAAFVYSDVEAGGSTGELGLAFVIAGFMPAIQVLRDDIAERRGCPPSRA
jgi:hypothetical protein